MKVTKRIKKLILEWYHGYEKIPYRGGLTYNVLYIRTASILLVIINLSILLISIYFGYLSIINNSTLGYIISIIFIGRMQYSLGFAMPHQGIHGTLFYNKFFDKYISEICLRTMSFWSMRFYKKTHWTHHAHTKDIEKDPGEQQYVFWGLNDKMTWFRIMIIQPILLIGTGNDIKRIIIDCKNDTNLSKELLTVRIPLILFVLIAKVFSLFLLLWIVPIFTTRFIISYWSEVSDHLGDTRTRNPIKPLLFFILRGPLARYDGYHEVHHTKPYIPRILLPQEYKQNKQRYDLSSFTGLKFNNEKQIPIS